jgi:hypothetical protein
LFRNSQDFQIVSLKLLISELLLACPGYNQQYEASFYVEGGNLQVDQHRKKEKTVYRDIFVTGEITEATLQLTDVRIYVSPENPGACEVAQVLQKEIMGLTLTASRPPTATHFLLYLAHETFVGEAGERLAEEVRAMMRTKQPIVMVHENNMQNGGCEFARFFSTTPQDLIVDGLYKPLAVALHPGHFHPVSVALVAKKLGAVSRWQQFWRSSRNLGSRAQLEMQIVVPSSETSLPTSTKSAMDADVPSAAIAPEHV